MTQDELLTKCELYMITEERLAECEPFSCNNEDLDDFFTNQATVFHKHLLAKPYMFCLKDSPNTIVCAFTLSNDSIRITNKFNEESKTKFLEGTNLSEKNMRRYPAVLIGRLGTNRQFAGQGIGSAVMECSQQVTLVFALSLLMPTTLQPQYTTIRRTALSF